MTSWPSCYWVGKLLISDSLLAISCVVCACLMFGCVSKVVGMVLTLRVVCAGSGSFSVSTNARMPLYNGLYTVSVYPCL